MQAIRVSAFGDESVLNFETLATPTPGRGQAVVTIEAVGVNPVETYIRAGTYPTRPPLPYTPGSDGAGVVEAVGEGVTTVKPGDRVYLTGSLSGTYATHTLVTADVHLQPLPGHLSFEQGAGLHVPYYTAYKAAFLRGDTRPGDTVLIHGATGGVGLAAVQWLRKLGVRLLATGGSKEGRDLLSAQGVTEVFDHKSPSYVDAIKAATPRGINVILEMLANVNLPVDLPLLAPKGRVIVIGNRGATTIDARHTMGKDADIRGMSLGNASPADYAQMHCAVAIGLESRELDPIIAKRFPLADAPTAHKTIMNTTAAGKIVLVP